MSQVDDITGWLYLVQLSLLVVQQLKNVLQEGEETHELALRQGTLDPVRGENCVSCMLTRFSVLIAYKQSVNHISLKNKNAKSPTAQDTYRTLPGLISYG